MKILGIETSCDETGLAIIDMSQDGTARVLGESISSQFDVHEPYGGIVPELASREHLRNLPLVLDTLLSDTKTSLEELAAIAVTRGPGLKGCLLMGLNFAKGVSIAKNIPLIDVNHIEGHLLAPMLDNPHLEFPYLALIVSGGHTEIHEVRGVGDYKLWARTTDDAAGEAFDKSASLLGFPYPGGPKLAELADSYTSSQFKLPKVMREASGFSFSGLKTAIVLLVKKQGDTLQKNAALRGELAWAIQDSIVDALLFKVHEAVGASRIKRLAVSGGVSANRYLRKKVSEMKGVAAFFPELAHCTDNGAMIAYVGGRRFLKGGRMDLEAQALARWPVETLSAP